MFFGGVRGSLCRSRTTQDGNPPGASGGQGLGQGRGRRVGHGLWKGRGDFGPWRGVWPRRRNGRKGWWRVGRGQGLFNKACGRVHGRTHLSLDAQEAGRRAGRGAAQRAAPKQERAGNGNEPARFLRRRVRRRYSPQGTASRKSGRTAARRVRHRAEFPQQVERQLTQAEEFLPPAERFFPRAPGVRDRLPPECGRGWLPDRPRSEYLFYGNEKTETSPHNSPLAMSSRSIDYATIRVPSEFPFSILPRKLW